MTLEETIKDLLEKSDKYERWAHNQVRMDYYSEEESAQELYQRASQYGQLAEWLIELKGEQNKQQELMKELQEVKQLLKRAVEDLNVTVAEVYNGGLVCKCCKWKSQIDGCCCPGDGGCDVAYRWRHIDEVLALIKEDEGKEIEMETKL